MGVLAQGLHTTRSPGICVNVRLEWARDSCWDFDGSISPSISLHIQKTRSRALICRQLCYLPHEARHHSEGYLGPETQCPIRQVASSLALRQGPVLK